jgi:hypothetical protein
MEVAVEVDAADFDDGDFDRMGGEELIPRRVTVTALPQTSQGAASHTCSCMRPHTPMFCDANMGFTMSRDDTQ